MSSSEDETLVYPANLHGLPDPVLTTLVDVMNSETASDAGGSYVTLTVNGMFVTGRIIPAWAFFSHIGENAASPEEHWSALLVRRLKEMGEVQESLRGMEEADYSPEQASEAKRETVFIHLAEARAFVPGSLTPIPSVGAFWRGRLSHISGWMYGTLGEGTTSP